MLCFSNFMTARMTNRSLLFWTLCMPALAAGQGTGARLSPASKAAAAFTSLQVGSRHHVAFIQQTGLEGSLVRLDLSIVSAGAGQRSSVP